ncbi:hypothetical protein PVAP13_8NG290724 [Panicum virgatum]|uniref:Uncharacterized protein n=1 Tax=Panicum virgatum TaxID=38727 RepID=A0A8T0PEG5_PANVG|nr:hypothetical protein PVAP13_8NG290724 [Panicum virgatum]
MSSASCRMDLRSFSIFLSIARSDSDPLPFTSPSILCSSTFLTVSLRLGIVSISSFRSFLDVSRERLAKNLFTRKLSTGDSSQPMMTMLEPTASIPHGFAMDWNSKLSRRTGEEAGGR